MIRKVALKIVQDLGEEGLPEPPQPEVLAKTIENTTPAASSSSSSDTYTLPAESSSTEPPTTTTTS